MKKLRIVRPVLKTRSEVERVVNETVAAQIRREAKVAKRDKALLAIGEEHNPDIDDLSAAIENNLALLEQWADASPGEFGDARSIAINGHRLGFRLGNPAVKPVGKLTVKAVIAAIAAKGGDLAKRFLRIKTDLDKEAVLATGRLLESSDELVRQAAEADLDAIGCTIEQSETFYLEPNREGQADTTMKGEAA